ncbi:unnamed protein product [Bursaphelenchus xylophilus]|uniref:(pine wood nematode) hypothetical protein n=1 Tax=Bursaphelenchus xylophilus TaxID=6326 RepID=A0A1I7RNW1_BURXY|nr:unnamed protein product [Bursaphelenchus xylophilus]CAG9124336.1 unnamed protein product [Bursaphelenchus xylophilus]
MSRGKNAYKRGNKTLAWYLGEKLLDKVDTQDIEVDPKRKNSVDSESSMNSMHVNQEAEPRPKKEKKPRQNRRRNVSEQSDKIEETFESPEPQTTPEPVKESYWYYDQTSDGFYYEHNGSRGWRKRNPKLHGNPPTNLQKKTFETEPNETPAPQTIEKKVYVPVPVPVFPTQASSKLFNQAAQPATLPNIKYYDPSTDGFFYEMASVNGWTRRRPSSSQIGQKADGSSMAREMTNHEVEELVLSKVDANGAPKLNIAMAQLLARQMSKNQQNQQTVDDYPSSSSTVSSTHSDDVTPPPPSVQNPNTQKDLNVGSFEEPYEFYWSDNEKNEKGIEPASSTSSVDEFVKPNPLSAFFGEMCLEDQNRPLRPDSLKIKNQLNAGNDKRLPRFNVDQFIADLPMGDADHFLNNLNSLATPLSLDSPAHFSHFPTKDSPFMTPVVNQKEAGWNRMDHASLDLERGLRDLERFWN